MEKFGGQVQIVRKFDELNHLNQDGGNSKGRLVIIYFGEVGTRKHC